MMVAWGNGIVTLGAVAVGAANAICLETTAKNKRDESIMIVDSLRDSSLRLCAESYMGNTLIYSQNVGEKASLPLRRSP